jgi:two-component system, sporulation sensor kinase E
MKAGFLEKLISRLDRLDPQSVQTHFLRLAKEKGLLETIFQSIQEGVVVLDGKGTITYTNRAAGELIGFNHVTAIGKPMSKFLREIDWNRILNLDTGEWTKLSSHQIEVRYPETRVLNFYVVPLSAVENTEKGAVIILRDVTRDRAQEASLVESERLNAVRLLAAGVAHEIGNPLNALNIHLQLLDRELKKSNHNNRPALLELVDVARTEVTRLDLIITQFLKAIRPSKPNLVKSQATTIIKDTLALLKQEIENRGAHVELEFPSDLPAVRLDKDQIKQAFFNIIKNALQAMPDGGLLRITAAASDRFLAVAFRDNGSGISPEDISHIFEPYYTTKSDGSGIGLMIVQRIIQDHGGRMDVHSEPGVGTTFTMFLPLDERRVHLLKPHNNRSKSPPEESP